MLEMAGNFKILQFIFEYSTSLIALMSYGMILPTMWLVRPAKAQTSLPIRADGLVA